MTKKLQAIIVNTRGIFECLIEMGVKPTEKDITNLHSGFEAVAKALERCSKTDETALGKEAKRCLDYYHDKHLEITGNKPTIWGTNYMQLLKKLLTNYDEQCVKDVTDFFLSYEKRVDYTLPTLARRFDVYYGKMKDMAEGRR